jgi:hypothetical protein
MLFCRVRPAEELFSSCEAHTLRQKVGTQRHTNIEMWSAKPSQKLMPVILAWDQMGSL